MNTVIRWAAIILFIGSISLYIVNEVLVYEEASRKGKRRIALTILSIIGALGIFWLIWPGFLAW